MTLLILILTRTINILAVLAVVCCEGSAGGRDGGQGRARGRHQGGPGRRGVEGLRGEKRCLNHTTIK